MNCKRAQAQIALAVGGDLDDAAERQLQEHLAGCLDCQERWAQMSDTWTLLIDREDELPDPHDSVWPDVQVRLPARQAMLSRARFNGWVVGLAVAGVCLAMVSMWNTANTPEPMLGDPVQIAGDERLDRPMPPLPRRESWMAPHVMPTPDLLPVGDGRAAPPRGWREERGDGVRDDALRRYLEFMRSRQTRE